MNGHFNTLNHREKQIYCRKKRKAGAACGGVLLKSIFAMPERGIHSERCNLFQGSAPPSGAVRCASHRTSAAWEVNKPWPISSAREGREGAPLRARGRRAPLFNSMDTDSGFTYRESKHSEIFHYFGI